MNKTEIKNILQRHPLILKALSTAFNYCPLNNKFSISKENNEFFARGGILKNVKITVKGHNNRIIISEFCRLINCKIVISGNNNTVRLNKWTYFEETEFLIDDNGGEIIVDEKTIISGKTHLAVIEGTTIKIGKDCLFSAGITIRTGDSHSILDKDSQKRINASKSVSIRDHVWIGNGVTILKGVVIKEGSIVATEAVVTKSPGISNCILGGNPAKVIKEDINWDATRIKMEENKNVAF